MLLINCTTNNISPHNNGQRKSRKIFMTPNMSSRIARCDWFSHIHTICIYFHFKLMFSTIGKQNLLFIIITRVTNFSAFWPIRLHKIVLFCTVRLLLAKEIYLPKISIKYYEDILKISHNIGVQWKRKSTNGPRLISQQQSKQSEEGKECLKRHFPQQKPFVCDCKNIDSSCQNSKDIKK